MTVNYNNSNGCTGASPATNTTTVNANLPVSVSVAASANPVCAGTSVTFTATPTNGGTTPFYQWQVNGVAAGTNSPTYSYTPLTGDAVKCIMTSNATCTTGNPATSNTITMTVYALPVPSSRLPPGPTPVPAQMWAIPRRQDRQPMYGMYRDSEHRLYDHLGRNR